MGVRIQLSALRKVKPHEYVSRFLLGGAITMATGLIATDYGPVVGGLFLAFPAIFPASATLLEKHQREKKRRAGLADTRRGRVAAAIDARGSALGALALMAFAALVWQALPRVDVPVVLSGALLLWVAVATTLWRLRRAKPDVSRT